jgi:ATP-dependent Lhr-like helicase
VESHLTRHGASFFTELEAATGLLPTRIEAALGELVAWGRVTADSFAGLRALLRPAHKRPSPRRMGRATALSFSAEGAGRLSLLQRVPAVPATEPPPGEAPLLASAQTPADGDPRALEFFAWVLLRRYGVVFRRLLEREPFTPPWRQLVRVYRRLEARGEIRGGRFVTAVSGEQYALPEAVGKLRETRRQARTGALLSLSAADPLNLVGVLTPGRRVPALTANRILFRDGVPIATLEGGETAYLEEIAESERWLVRNALLGRNITPLPLGAAGRKRS